MDSNDIEQIEAMRETLGDISRQLEAIYEREHHRIMALCKKRNRLQFSIDCLIDTIAEIDGLISIGSKESQAC